jgi:hypothetical protein
VTKVFITQRICLEVIDPSFKQVVYFLELPVLFFNGLETTLKFIDVCSCVNIAGRR